MDDFRNIIGENIKDLIPIFSLLSLAVYLPKVYWNLPIDDLFPDLGHYIYSNQTDNRNKKNSMTKRYEKKEKKWYMKIFSCFPCITVI